MKTTLMMITILVSLVWASAVLALDVKLQWEPNTESDIAGYKVYYGVNGLSNPTHLDVRNQTVATISGLDPALNYSFAIAAYNTSGLEAPYSNEVTALESVAPTVSITSPGNNTQVNSTVSISTNASDNAAVTMVEFYVNGVIRAAVNTTPYNYNWDTKTVSDGSYILTAKAYDAAGNTSTTTAVTVTVKNAVSDTTAPVVNKFTMPVSATSLTAAVSLFKATDNVGVTGYLITESATVPAAGATGWTASAPFGFTFSSAGSKTAYAWTKDAAGNVSASRSATVIITLSDTTPPSVYNFSPSANESVFGTAYVGADASDNNGVSKIEFYVNGILSATVYETPYIFSWNTTVLANGSYTLIAKAYDAAGNMGKSAIVTVTVNNLVPDTSAPDETASTTPATSTSLTEPDTTLPDTILPVISFNAPAGGAIVSGSVAVTATASDNIGVARVELYINGVLTITDSAAPFIFTWNTTTLTNGSYTLKVLAYDAAGNSAASDLTVTVNNPVSPRKNRKGDLNGDGKIDIADALLALMQSVKLTAKVAIGETDDSLDGDVAPLDASGAPHGNGVVDIADALMILKKAVGSVNWI